VGLAIKDMVWPEHCVITAIIRKGEVMIPRGVNHRGRRRNPGGDRLGRREKIG
jgi:hypothetical protein